MKKIIPSAILASLALLSIARTPSSLPLQSPDCGRIDRHNLYSSNLADSIAIDVWLPEGYNPADTILYPVIYMHDGQHLFDATNTWNHQAWEMDSVACKLINEDLITPPVIVGIHSDPDLRVSQLMPQNAVANAGLEDLMSEFRLEGNPVLGNQYTYFVVDELIPYINNNYSVLANRENTFTMGSSMGGLMSLYLICKYPDTFGGAGCLSTHWYGSLKDDRFGNAMMEFVETYLPDPATHKLYFDHGTTTIDAYYGPWEEKALKIAERHGYQPGMNLLSVVAEGAPHNEDAWKRRVAIPLEFLLKK